MQAFLGLRDKTLVEPVRSSDIYNPGLGVVHLVDRQNYFIFILEGHRVHGLIDGVWFDHEASVIATHNECNSSVS